MYAVRSGRATNTPRSVHFRTIRNLHGHQEPSTSGRVDTREENCNGTVARLYPDACGLVCAGHDSHRAATAGLRTARPTSWGGIHMAGRLSPLRRRPICLDARPLPAATPKRSTLGRPPLGPPSWRICDGRRPLAVGFNLNTEGEVGASPSTCPAIKAASVFPLTSRFARGARREKDSGFKPHRSFL